MPTKMTTFSSSPLLLDLPTTSSPQQQEEEEEQEEDQFEKLPDAMVLLILGFLPDAKSLGRCSLVSRRLRSLTAQVDSLLLRVDCVLPHPCGPHHHNKQNPNNNTPPSSLLSRLSRFLLSALSHILPLPSSSSSSSSHKPLPSPAPHHSPSEVLRAFPSLRHLRVELPTAGDDSSLLRWSARFGSSLRRCAILAASSSHPASPRKPPLASAVADDLCANGGLRSRVVWTISSLIAASARHHLVRPIADSHPSLRSLVMADADGQGVLRMDAADLGELRASPPPAATPSRRTPVPSLSMRLWYAPWLEVPGGVALEGATLVAITPSGVKEEGDGEWVAEAFAEAPYAAAAGLLMKGKAYCLEMNSF